MINRCQLLPPLLHPSLVTEKAEWPPLSLSVQLALHPILICLGGGEFPPSISALSLCPGMHRSRSRSTPPTRAPRAPRTADANSHGRLCSGQQAGDGRSHHPSLGCNHHASTAPRARRCALLTSSQFIRKGRSSGAARWKRCAGRGTGRARLSRHHCPPTPCASPTSSPPPFCLFVLWGLSHTAGVSKPLAIVDVQPPARPSPELAPP